MERLPLTTEVGLGFNGGRKDGKRFGRLQLEVTAEKGEGVLGAQNGGEEKPEWSVNRANATCYGPLALVAYNWWFCLVPARFEGFEWCGQSFCCPSLVRCQFTMRRDRWVYLVHLLAFIIHTVCAIYSAQSARGNDMRVAIFRVKPSWENRGGDYAFSVTPLDEHEQIVYIDTLTWLFFAFSAAAHGIWVFCGPWKWSEGWLWRQLDNCCVPSRWLEYGFSASLMTVGIAVTSAIRDRAVLVCIFVLMLTTMCLGLVTELHSRPHRNADGTFDMDRWQGDEVGQSLARKWRNYLYRMIPHWIGFVPYGTAWWVVAQTFFDILDDLCEPLRERMPDFVVWIVFGSISLFSCFTPVQIWFQWRPPKHYWKTEIVYPILSATAKVFLGGYLWINVLAKASFEEAVELAGSNYTDFNLTAACLGNWTGAASGV